VLELCRSLEESYNTNAASDLECAGYLATAGLNGCSANVKINLPYIKDNEICQEIESKLEEILN
ncbi:MAG: cyclodeaminase/cyclohydrolase family protein, partial [Deltaproteobacteria bacterium]|nr:cyclodeaminase/cyclohydrolase family protein [Deltaproteobacteria bacterium]